MKAPSREKTGGSLAHPRRPPGLARSIQRRADEVAAPCPSCLAHDLAEIAVDSRPEHRRENRTGLPDTLKAGLERLSGLDLSAVRVHRDSQRPARIEALAYTQGTDIHLAPGEERHLPHEGWHVVQQLGGRVRPTGRAQGEPINDDRHLEREADTLGARAAAFETRLAIPGEPDEEEGLFTEDPGAAPIQGVIQRVATFADGRISATTNLAAHFLAGGANVGFTPPTLNGTAISSVAGAQAALEAPTLKTRTLGDGTAEAQIDTVPTNRASFTMQLPTNGPWRMTTEKAKVVALFARIGLRSPGGCGTHGDTIFRVRGRPSDKELAANVRTHEDLHASDHRSIFAAVVVPWDTKLEAARTAATTFPGADPAAARAALHKAMGGTPDGIGRALYSGWHGRNNATHRNGTTLATGAEATPSNARANDTCGASFMDVT